MLRVREQRRDDRGDDSRLACARWPLDDGDALVDVKHVLDSSELRFIQWTIV